MEPARVRIPTRKISETILDFGEPLLGQTRGAIPLDEARPALEIVIMIWNAHVMAMPVWGDTRPLEALADLVYQSGTPAEVMTGFEVLSARRSITSTTIRVRSGTGRSSPTDGAASSFGAMRACRRRSPDAADDRGPMIALGVRADDDVAVATEITDGEQRTRRRVLRPLARRRTTENLTENFRKR